MVSENEQHEDDQIGEAERQDSATRNCLRAVACGMLAVLAVLFSFLAAEVSILAAVDPGSRGEAQAAAAGVIGALLFFSLGSYRVSAHVGAGERLRYVVFTLVMLGVITALGSCLFWPK